MTAGQDLDVLIKSLIKKNSFTMHAADSKELHWRQRLPLIGLQLLTWPKSNLTAPQARCHFIAT